MSDKVLVVEDEVKIADVIIDYLQANDYQTQHIARGEPVIDWVKEHLPDMILLDLMLPGKDGLTLCREIRAFSDVPIIMITARVEEIDRILGLDLGADDYICKPFSPREVVSRVNAIMRRIHASRKRQDVDDVTNTGIVINHNDYDASFKGRTLTLTPAEFRLICTLSKSPIRVYSRQQLIDKLYDDGRIVTDRTVDTHIKNLRKKMHQAGVEGDSIISIYGVGYKWSVE